MNIKDAYNEFMKDERNMFRNKYGDLVDRIWNPYKLAELSDQKYDPLIVFKLLDKLYLELANFYKLEYSIRIESTSIAFVLNGKSTCISIEKDEVDKKTYIVVYGFYLPKIEINQVNGIMNDVSYSRNGYRIIKTLEIICKCWSFDGVKYNRIVNNQLGKNLLSEGYDNIYKLRGERVFPDQDYVKWISNNEEVNKNYSIQYELKKSAALKNRILKRISAIFKE